MRKSFIIFLLVGAVALGLGIFNSLKPVKSTDPETAQTKTQLSQTLGVSLKDLVYEPVSFTIPKLNVKASIEYVGLNPKGAMDIPKKDEDVAWYNLGVKPGEIGNAVIAGHYDKKDGSPAVFFEVNKLKAGDEFMVKDKAGKEYKFAVTQVASYKQEEFPLQEVFGASSKSRLNLITCEGVYDKTSKLYSHRLVVYSELKR